ncbi:hypothetical protein [Candidatus Williamhamiltonella defendens]|uniref:hypothetical protein n=1 Tax=Candidatus Williamhamiltonella defendens TaxID=138072 RepID=UPI00130E9CE9
MTSFTVKGKKSTSMIEERGELLCKSVVWDDKMVHEPISECITLGNKRKTFNHNWLDTANTLFKISF